MNEGFSDRLNVHIPKPVFEDGRIILSVASVNLHIIELDGARGDVLRSRWGGLSLEWQAQEGLLIELEDEEVPLHVVVEGQLPS